MIEFQGDKEQKKVPTRYTFGKGGNSRMLTARVGYLMMRATMVRYPLLRLKILVIPQVLSKGILSSSEIN